MAKKSNKISFTKTTLTKSEDGDYIVEEVGKDSSKTYNLSKELDQLLNEQGLAITISQDNELPNEE